MFHNAKNIFQHNPDNIQEEIIPLILDNILNWSEYVQINAGDMFDLLLREGILVETYKPQLKKKCMDMIKIWS